jgi:hypothetical protein
MNAQAHRNSFAERLRNCKAGFWIFLVVTDESRGRSRKAIESLVAIPTSVRACVHKSQKLMLNHSTKMGPRDNTATAAGTDPCRSRSVLIGGHHCVLPLLQVSRRYQLESLQDIPQATSSPEYSSVPRYASKCGGSGDHWNHRSAGIANQSRSSTASEIASDTPASNGSHGSKSANNDEGAQDGLGKGEL